MGLIVLVDTQEKADRLCDDIQRRFKAGHIRRWSEDLKPITWSMKKTWRMWMSETGEFMASRGVTMPLMHSRDGKPWGSRPFNKDDAHELFVRKYLGVDAYGERYKTATGDKGRMLYMMDCHVGWAEEKGLALTIPNDGEYLKLKKESVS